MTEFRIPFSSLCLRCLRWLSLLGALNFFAFTTKVYFARLLCGGVRPVADWKHDDDAAAAPSVAVLDVDAPAVCLDDALRDGESHPGPSGPGRARVAVAHGAEEFVEDALAQVRGDALPFVFDGERDCVARAAPGRDADGRALRGILRGVVNQSVDDLGDRARVNAHDGQLVFERDFHLALPRERRGALQSGRDYLLD